MRKKLLVLLILGILLSVIEIKAQWRLSPTNNTSTEDIMFVDNLTGYQVGRFGYMTKTTDGGVTWNALASRINKDLYAVYFVSATIGFAGGDNIFLKTIDGGDTWLYLNSPMSSSARITSIYFIDEKIGWMCTSAGEIINTVDGGYNWNKYTSPHNFNDIFFTSPLNGWVVGTSGTILKTTNGGDTWAAAGPSISTTVDVVGVEFANANRGWITARNGFVYRTSNGGATWQATSSAVASTLYQTTFVSTTVGYGGTNGGVVKTTDGGATWSSAGLSSDVYCLDFYSATNGTIGSVAGINYYTQNGGTSYTAVSDEFNYSLSGYGLSFLDPNTGWSVGESGMIRKTSNGGNSWVSQSSGTTTTLLAVSFLNSLEGWTTGLGGVIRKTTDGGTTWNAQTSGTVNNLFGMYFFSTTTGIIVGDAGRIIRTTDGGTNWSNISSGTSSTLRGVYFVSGGTGWAVGTGGTIIKSTNSGASWSTLSSGTTNNLLAVHFPSGSVGYTVGLSGTILKTNDGGVTWTAQTSNTSSHLTSVYFTSVSEGWAVGYNGTILHTLDGGTTWVDLDLGFTLQPLNAVVFINSGLGYVLGNSGIILQYKSSCAPPAPVNYTFSINEEVCTGSSAVLMASGMGKIGWWTAPTGGTYLGEGFALGGGSHYLTPTLTTTTTFYAEDFTCSASLSRTAFTVTVNSILPSDATTQTGLLLSALETSAGIQYQWINCNDNFLIPGASSQTYTPAENGSYAVALNLGGCLDTSSCLQISGIASANDAIVLEGVNFFPNPVSDKITIEITNPNWSLDNDSRITIKDITGRVMTIQELDNNSLQNVNVTQLVSGLYVLELESEGQVFRKKFLKK